MGMILDVSKREKVHAEARRESFCVYDDFGKGFHLELDWELLPHLKRAVDALDKYRRRETRKAKR